MRQNWKFRLPAIRVANAASAKAQYHRERERYWVQELEKAETALKGSVEFREHVVTGGKNFAVVVDHEKQTHTNNCASKRDDHRSQAEQYEAFAIALNIEADSPQTSGVELDVDDIRFFGLTSGKAD